MSVRTRFGIGLLGLSAAALQVLVGAIATMGLAAPGVGPEADWVPTALISAGFTLVPVGFGLCLVGATWSLRLAALCAVVTVGLGIAAAFLLAGADGGPIGIAMVLPGLVLGATIAHIYRHRTEGQASRGRHWASRPR
jgi:hypothetical protein